MIDIISDTTSTNQPTAVEIGTMATPSDKNTTDESTNMNTTLPKETHSGTANSDGGNRGERSGGDTMTDSGTGVNGGNDVLADNGAGDDLVRDARKTGKKTRKKSGDKEGKDVGTKTESYDDKGKLKWRQWE